MTPRNSALSVTDRAIPPINFGLFNRFDVTRFMP